jgi:transposase
VWVVEEGMSTRFVNIDRTTPMLLPPDMRDWVQDDDLAHFLVDALALVDLSAAAVNSRGTGSEQYPPAMMLSVLIYCYANGLFSSREIEKATYRHVSVRYLAANTHPDHDTVATFRRQNGPLIRSVFVQVLQLAQRTGLLKLGAVALDGTKIQANASKRKTLSALQVAQELRRLDEQVAQLLEQAETADQKGEPQTELPCELVDGQKRRARLLQAKAQLEAQARQRYAQREAQWKERPPGDKPRHVSREPRPTDTINPTDPDSTLTPTAQRPYIQGYNAQVAVSVGDTGLIVAADVVRDTNDIQQLQPMMKQMAENTPLIPAHVLVDTGYENIRQIMAVENQLGTQVLCPPAPITAGPSKGPKGTAWRHQRKQKRQQLRAQLQSAAGRALYALRSTSVEPVIGILKSALGFDRFRLRGLPKVQLEWRLISLAFNCRRLAAKWA